MPHPPAASQPAPFSTPNPSRFRLPKPKRPDRTGVAETALPPEGHTMPAGQQAYATGVVRPTPRFAPSWQKQTPVSAARKFSAASAANGDRGSIGASSSSSGGLRRRRRHVSSSHQTRRHSSLDDDLVFRGGSDDAIEDGSSPPVPSETPDDDDTVLAVRESPTTTRRAEPPPPGPFPHSTPAFASAGKTLWQPNGRQRQRQRQRRRTGLQEDIEDVAASSMDEEGAGSTDRGDEGEDEVVVAVSGDVPETVDNSGEVVSMPDVSVAVADRMSTATTHGLPAPQEQPPLMRQQPTLAARLLSSVQPFKRRRLFVSPGLITSSPPAGYHAEEEEEDGDNERRAFENRPQRRHRRYWGGDDDIVDNESSNDDNENDGQQHAMDYEEIRDIVNYGELLEYGDSSDDDGPEKDDDMIEEGREHRVNDEDEDEDDDMDILNRTPTRIRRARQQKQMGVGAPNDTPQGRQQPEQRQWQRLPTFQRARLFVPARKPTGDGDLEGDEDDGRGADRARKGEDKEDDGETEMATPARQRQYDDLQLHQPPADFFSPQKRRQKRGRRSHRHEDNGEDASTAAAAMNAPEQYVPGGLAAELRDWLVQIKSGGGTMGRMAVSLASTAGNADPGGPGGFGVSESKTVPGMSLVLGRRKQQQEEAKIRGEERRDVAEKPDGHPAGTTKAPPVRLLLAGEGRQLTASRSSAYGSINSMQGGMKEAVVSIAHPVWEVVLSGQPWVVASDWSVHEK